MTICVYAIRHNTIHGLSYVGSTVGLDARWNSHRNKLRRSSHHCIALQRAWDAQGENAFRFEVLEYVSEVSLAERESFWMNELRANGNGTFNHIKAGRHIMEVQS
jgi:group I intron endonuclease